MIQSSISLAKKERIFFIGFSKFLSLLVDNEKVYIRIMGIKIPFPFKRRRIYIPKKLVYIKKGYSFLRKWKVKEIEADISFSDPMINGIAYGMMSAIDTIKIDQRVKVNINFFGKNRLKAEFLISNWEFMKNLISFFIPLLIEMRRGHRKGGR